MIPALPAVLAPARNKAGRWRAFVSQRCRPRADAGEVQVTAVVCDNSAAVRPPCRLYERVALLAIVLDPDRFPANLKRSAVHRGRAGIGVDARQRHRAGAGLDQRAAGAAAKAAVGDDAGDVGREVVAADLQFVLAETEGARRR